MNMRKTIILTLLLVCAAMNAQTSRKKIEKFATEAVKQIALTGRNPSIDVLDTLANNAEVSIEMLSRMGEPDDARQAKACLKLIDGIVDYSQTTTGRRYTDIVRSGLKKAIDRSYETDVQQHIMEQLGRCAKPADAAHIAMYLEVEELAPTAQRILLAMPEADNQMAEAAASQPGIKAKVKNILDAHAGKATAAIAPQPVRPKPAAMPFWTTTLDKAIDDMAREADAETSKIVIDNNSMNAIPLLIRQAEKKEGKERNATIARLLTMMGLSGIAAERRYLMLRAADAMVTDTNLRNKIIVALGETHTIQALAYLRKYYGKPEHADAMAVAAANIISMHPEANGGNMVNGMLYTAKQSFIRHYDEQGVDTYIDQTLAAIDNWRADNGYNFNHTEETRMEKRGFWIIHDELADFDMTFDWRASGSLTLSLRSTPMLILDRNHGAKLANDNTWHKLCWDDEWATANISVKGNMISVAINGQKVMENALMTNSEANENANKSGYVKFLADEQGATIRGYCFLKK